MSEMEVVRESIKMERVDIMEAIESVKELPTGLKLVNVRGTNGSGKSTIPLQMLANDREAYMLTLEGKDVATVFPTFGWLALGKYRNAAGGLDTVRTTDDMKHILSLCNKLPFNILMEGILASTVYSTYSVLLQKYQEETPFRKAGVMSIVNDMDVVKARIMKRNGGKQIKFEQVESKWRTVKKNVQKFKDDGLASWETSNQEIAKEETLDWFFKELEVNMKDA